jgi:hypothetical protein
MTKDDFSRRKIAKRKDRENLVAFSQGETREPFLKGKAKYN